MPIKRAKRRRMGWQRKGRSARSRVPLGAPLHRVKTKPLTPEMERFMSPDELANRIRGELLEKGFILRVGSVGYWVIREKERDHDGSGAVVYHPWIAVNYYGKRKWAVFPENRSAEAKFYDARAEAMAAAFKIARSV